MTEATAQMIELECVSNGWGFQKCLLVGDSLIVHARNVLLAYFLRSDATDLFFLDSDVGFGSGIFTRLMMHRVRMVAAIYRLKTPEENYALNFPDPTKIMLDRRTDLIEVNDVPFGAVRIAREVVESMVAADPDAWFSCIYEPGLKCPMLFNTELKNNMFMGEDFYFCRKYREIGGHVWVDADITTVHVGSHPDGTDKNHVGNLAEFLKGRGA